MPMPTLGGDSGCADRRSWPGWLTHRRARLWPRLVRETVLVDTVLAEPLYDRSNTLGQRDLGLPTQVPSRLCATQAAPSEVAGTGRDEGRPQGCSRLSSYSGIQIVNSCLSTRTNIKQHAIAALSSTDKGVYDIGNVDEVSGLAPVTENCAGLPRE